MIDQDGASAASEHELRLSAARLRTVFESIDQGYCVCEMVVVDCAAVDYRFVEVNARFEEMTGLADATGRTARELVRGLERHWIDTYARVALGGETLRFEQGSDAMGRWFDVFAVPVAPAGHFALVFRDQTERRSTELALLESEQRLAAALETERSTRGRVELLQRNATQLAVAITVDDLATSLLGELKDSLGLGFTALEVLNGDLVTLIAPSELPDAMVERFRHVPLDADFAGTIAIRTNQPVVLIGREHIADRFPVVADPANQLPPFETLVALPLRAASGRAIGALFLASVDVGWLDAITLDLLTSIAGQAGLALERAQLHQQVLDASEEEHAIVIKLQRALLPDRLADQANLEIAARYSAATDLMAVGGDWYDTFAWPDGHLVVTVGDVVGHDIAAATTMGRLRIGVNALVSRVASDPAAVLDAYRDYGDDLGPAFATAACVAIHGATGRVRYSVAGHPAPMVLFPDGRIEWLAGAMSPPLGVPSDADHGHTSTQLVPGATVVLYSDGLIERRGEIIDAGFARLASSAARHAGVEPGALADAILADLTGDVEIADDVIVVCVRWWPAEPA